MLYSNTTNNNYNNNNYNNNKYNNNFKFFNHQVTINLN